MSEPQPEQCPRCGAKTLSGLVEELVPMRLDVAPVAFDEALVLHKYRVPLADVLLRPSGVVMSRLFWPSANAPGSGWLTLVAHGCDWKKWER